MNKVSIIIILFVLCLGVNVYASTAYITRIASFGNYKSTSNYRKTNNNNNYFVTEFQNYGEADTIKVRLYASVSTKDVEIGQQANFIKEGSGPHYIYIANQYSAYRYAGAADLFVKYAYDGISLTSFPCNGKVNFN
ncbi:MAG: hypothetical protein RR659_05205 [Bacilli bacterium]